MRLLEDYNEYEYLKSLADDVDQIDYMILKDGTKIFNGGRSFDNNIIMDCFRHSESDTYWIICRHKNGQYYEEKINNVIRAGNFKTTVDLSGGSQW